MTPRHGNRKKKVLVALSFCHFCSQLVRRRTFLFWTNICTHKRMFAIFSIYLIHKAKDGRKGFCHKNSYFCLDSWRFVKLLIPIDCVCTFIKMTWTSFSCYIAITFLTHLFFGGYFCFLFSVSIIDHVAIHSFINIVVYLLLLKTGCYHIKIMGNFLCI